MTKAEMALFIQTARRSGVPWSGLVHYLGLSKERLAQIGGYRVHRRIRKAVIARADGICHFCKLAVKKFYVAKIDTTKENNEENLIACCRYCFYDQNQTDRNIGIEAKNGRRYDQAQVLLSQIARDLGVDGEVSDTTVDGVAPSGGQEAPPIPEEAAAQPIPTDGDGTRSNNGTGGVGG